MRSIIFILLLASFSFSALLMITGDIRFFALIGVAILPIILSVYFDKLGISLFVLLASCILSSITVFFGVQRFLISAMVLSFIIVYVVLSENKRIFLQAKDKFQAQIDNKRKLYKDLLKENEKVSNLNQEINTQSEEIENLYEITKHMSAYLRFDEIFKMLCSELKNTFEFDDCRLINIKNIKGVIEIDEIYNIATEGKIKDAKSYNKKILDLVYQRRDSLLITSVKSDTTASTLNLPRDIETLLAIPLTIENEINNVVIVENIKAENFEKFSIVIGQFALEMRKVKLYELVEKLAITDGLTNLLLRRHFLKSLEKELKRATTYNLKISVLMIDIDHFKKFNDRYGHLAGDSVLVKISDIIRNNTREIDLISRYGGEEFALALLETDKKGVLVVAERIRTQVERESFIAEGKLTRATVSIGISCFPDDSQDVTQLIDMSDQALYEAKRSGRNTTCVYESSS